MISYQSSILHFKQFKREPAFEYGWTEKRRSKKNHLKSSVNVLVIK